MRICYLLTLLSVLVGAVSNSVAQTEADGPYWIRQPQISPDGQSIAFTYRGQIWIVPSAGGEAIPLTERQFRSTAPVWSPDSRLVAFGSDRYSVSDVFVMPVEGGPITRLTHNSQLARPLAFSADGNEVLFAAARLGDPEADYLRGLGGSLGMIHSVPVAGGRERLVMPFPTRQADVSPDGGTIAYVKVNSVEQEWRKREISDGTSDIWLYDIEAKTHRRLTDYRGRDRSPAFSADGSEIYWTTEMSEAESDPDAAPGTFNVWRMPVDAGAHRHE
jgi:tricorn protease